MASLDPSYGSLRELEIDSAETVRCAAFMRSHLIASAILLAVV
jgi:hypothetical protein